MAQVVLGRFYWTSFRTRDGKYRCIRFIFSICEAALGIFLYLTRNQAEFCSIRSTQPLVEFFAEDAFPVSTVAGLQVPVFQKRGQSRTKLFAVTGQDSSCWPVRVHRSQIIYSTALSRSLFLQTTPVIFCFPFSLGLSRKRLKLYLPR